MEKMCSEVAQRYMHAIDGRDLEIAKDLSMLASVDDVQSGASSALRVLATLEQLVRPSATAELPGQTPSARSSTQELKPIAGLSGPELY